MATEAVPTKNNAKLQRVLRSQQDDTHVSMVGTFYWYISSDLNHADF